LKIDKAFDGRHHEEQFFHNGMGHTREFTDAPFWLALVEVVLKLHGCVE
jgi:hypothetical protein